MEYSTNRALLIGVSVFITLSITSAILVIIGQVKDVYKYVYNTNISLKDRFNEFDMYNGTVMTGLDMYNTVKKYKSNANVDVLYYNNKIAVDNANNIINVSNFSYDTKYKVDHAQNDGRDIIKFTNY